MTQQNPGIEKLYFDFADSHVALHERRGSVKKISRAEVELKLLNEIDRAEIPIEYKLSWYHTVLVSSDFDPFWMAFSTHHGLPNSCTARYRPDQNLREYKEPTDNGTEEAADDEAEEEEEQDRSAAPTKHTSPSTVPTTPALVTDRNSRTSTPSSSDISSSSDTDTGSEMRALKHKPYVHRPIPRCPKCGSSSCIPGRCFTEEYNQNRDDESIEVPPPYFGTQALDLSDDAEGDDSEYKEPPSKKDVNGKAKASTTIKSASKPKGVIKKKATTKKKEQTPAQLKTAAAKTREPAKPKATKKIKKTSKKSAENPSQVAITPGQASYNAQKATEAATEPDEVDKKIADIKANMGPAQEAGIKRMMEQFPDDENDSPAPVRKTIPEKKPSDKPIQAANVSEKVAKKTPAVKPGASRAQEAGKKRTLAQAVDDADDEDDFPATKKAKIGDAASVNGGRKKAPVKKSRATAKKSEETEFKEWDGVFRGFGEY